MSTFLLRQDPHSSFCLGTGISQLMPKQQAEKGEDGDETEPSRGPLGKVYCRYGWGTAALLPRSLLGTSTRCSVLKLLQHGLWGPNNSLREILKVQVMISSGVPISHLTL